MCGAPKSSPSPTNSPRLRREPGYTVPAITSTASDCATISARQRDAGGEDAAEADDREGGDRPMRARRRASGRRPPRSAGSSTARTRAPPSRRTEPRLRRRTRTRGRRRPFARHRSRAARARTAPRSGGASTPSGPSDHQWLTGASSDDGRRRDGDPGPSAEAREPERQQRRPRGQPGTTRSRRRRASPAGRRAALAATASQWSRADGTSRAVGATSATSGNASGEAKPSSPRDMRPRSQGVPRFHSSIGSSRVSRRAPRTRAPPASR